MLLDPPPRPTLLPAFVDRGPLRGLCADSAQCFRQRGSSGQPCRVMYMSSSLLSWTTLDTPPPDTPPAVSITWWRVCPAFVLSQCGRFLLFAVPAPEFFAANTGTSEWRKRTGRAVCSRRKAKPRALGFRAETVRITQGNDNIQYKTKDCTVVWPSLNP